MLSAIGAWAEPLPMIYQKPRLRRRFPPRRNNDVMTHHVRKRTLRGPHLHQHASKQLACRSLSLVDQAFSTLGQRPGWRR